MLCPKIKGKDKPNAIKVCECVGKGLWISEDRVCVCETCGKTCIIGKAKLCFKSSKDGAKVFHDLTDGRYEPIKSVNQSNSIVSAYPKTDLCRVVDITHQPHKFLSKDGGNTCDLCAKMSAIVSGFEPVPPKEHRLALVIEVKGKVVNNQKKIDEYLESIKKRAAKDGVKINIKDKKGYTFKELVSEKLMYSSKPRFEGAVDEVNFKVDKK